LSSDAKRANQRSILRVHVHQLSLFTHPLINDEERLYNNLKKMNVQYCSVFESRTTGYLTYRLFALITELGHFKFPCKLKTSIRPQSMFSIRCAGGASRGAAPWLTDTAKKCRQERGTSA
jgi:hypothetical protein